MRYFLAAVGFCVISVAYGAVTGMVLGVVALADCILTDEQVDAGETCVALADVVFLPLLIAALLGFIAVQWAFLRAVLRKP
jgi:hypothetical protein